MQRIEEDLRAVRHGEERHAVTEIDGRSTGQVGGVEDQVRRVEDDVHAALEVRVAPDQLGKRVAFELLHQVEAVETLQVIEPVAVLQVLELLLEHEVEGRAEETAEHGLALGHAAGPEVHRVETARGGGLEHERPVRGDEREGRAPFASQGRCARDGRMGAVCGHEVDQRLGMFDVEAELEPVRIGLDRRVARRREELPAGDVQARNALASAARHVDRRQIEGQAEQLVAHRLSDELVELVADGSRQAAHDAARGLVSRQRSGGAAVVVRLRSEERIEQPDVVRGFNAVHDVDARHDLGQHRVAEAIDGVRELGHDRCVDRREAAEERVDQGLNLAREFLEHEVLVLHLGAEPRGLEQPFTVIPTGGCVHRVPRRDLCRRQQRVDPAVDIVREAVVLRVEDLVHHRQRDVLVAASIARDHVNVQQLVVIGAGILDAGAEVGDRGIRIRRETGRGHRIVRDVVEERGTGAEGVRRNEHAQSAVGRGTPLQKSAGPQNDLREAVRTGLEAPVRIRQQQRHVEEVRVEQLNAEQSRRLQLDVGPAADVADVVARDAGWTRRAEGAVKHQAGLHGFARSVLHVLAQEHLM